MNERSEAAVRAIDSHGELPMTARQQLFDPEGLSISEVVLTEAFARIELLCAEKAAPYWLEKFGDDREPVEVLRAIVTSNPRSVEAPKSLSALGALKRKLDDSFALGPEYVRAIYAGFACWAAARNWIYPADVPSLTTEIESEPEEWTAAFMASLAISGGAVWEKGVGDANARRSYWIWYIETCETELAARMRS